MGQYILLFAGGAMVLVIIVGFFRSYWPQAARRDGPTGAGDWDNSRLPEHILGTGNNIPPSAEGGGGGHH